MDIELKHNPEECENCAYQQRINKICTDKDVGIEFDFFKMAGDFIPTVTYTGYIDGKKLYLRPPLFVKEYNRGDDIVMIEFLPDEALGKMYKELLSTRL